MARKDITIEMVIDLYNQGFGTKLIARKLGCSRTLVKYRLKWAKERGG